MKNWKIENTALLRACSPTNARRNRLPAVWVNSRCSGNEATLLGQERGPVVDVERWKWSLNCCIKQESLGFLWLFLRPQCIATISHTSREEPEEFSKVTVGSQAASPLPGKLRSIWALTRDIDKVEMTTLYYDFFSWFWTPENPALVISNGCSGVS